MKNPEINKDGDEIWRNERGEFHRTDGPAVIWKDGTEFWYQNDLQHRTDGPAVIWGTGKEYWFINDKSIKPIPNIIFQLRKKLNESTH